MAFSFATSVALLGGNKPFKITTRATSGGKITPRVANPHAGEVRQFVITPNEGFRVVSVSGCGAGIWNPLTYTFTTAPASVDCEISALFHQGPNQTPLVSAGADQSVQSGGDVLLSGSASDTDGVVVSVLWRQASGPAVLLSTPDQSSLSFVAPEVAADSICVFEFTATDNEGAVSSDSVSVSVARANIGYPHSPIVLRGDKSAGFSAHDMLYGSLYGSEGPGIFYADGGTDFLKIGVTADPDTGFDYNGSFLRFNLAGMPSFVKSVKLRLYVQPKPDNGYWPAYVTADPSSSDYIFQRLNLPDSSTPFLASSYIGRPNPYTPFPLLNFNPSGGWHEFDVTRAYVHARRFSNGSSIVFDAVSSFVDETQSLLYNGIGVRVPIVANGPSNTANTPELVVEFEELPNLSKIEIIAPLLAYDEVDWSTHLPPTTSIFGSDSADGGKLVGVVKSLYATANIPNGDIYAAEEGVVKYFEDIPSTDPNGLGYSQVKVVLEHETPLGVFTTTYARLNSIQLALPNNKFGLGIVGMHVSRGQLIGTVFGDGEGTKYSYFFGIKKGPFDQWSLRETINQNDPSVDDFQLRYNSYINPDDTSVLLMQPWPDWNSYPAEWVQ